MSAMIQGHRAQLAPGVLVSNVSVSTNGGGNWNDVVLELKVDPNAVGAVDNLLQGLQQLIQGGHAIQHSTPMMTAQVAGFVTSPPAGWLSDEELAEVEGEMERDPDDLEEPVTLLTLRDLINERMDDMDAALRLAIGE